MLASCCKLRWQLVVLGSSMRRTHSSWLGVIQAKAKGCEGAQQRACSESCRGHEAWQVMHVG